jgi:hypothetical protein
MAIQAKATMNTDIQNIIIPFVVAGGLNGMSWVPKKQRIGRAGKKKRGSILYERQRVMMVKKTTRATGTTHNRRSGGLTCSLSLIPEMRYKANGSSQIEVIIPEYHPRLFGEIGNRVRLAYESRNALMLEGLNPKKGSLKINELRIIKRMTPTTSPAKK